MAEVADGSNENNIRFRHNVKDTDNGNMIANLSPS